MSNDPYRCPRCGANIPEDHEALSHYEGWRCPDGVKVWLWYANGITHWMLGTRRDCIKAAAKEM